MQTQPTANSVIPFYSSYGTTHKLARAVSEGAAEVPGSTVRLRRIPELPSAEEGMSGQDAYDEAQDETSPGSSTTTSGGPTASSGVRPRASATWPRR